MHSFSCVSPLRGDAIALPEDVDQRINPDEPIKKRIDKRISHWGNSYRISASLKADSIPMKVIATGGTILDDSKP